MPRSLRDWRLARRCGDKGKRPAAHLERSLQGAHATVGFSVKFRKALAAARFDDKHALALLENPGIVTRRIDLYPAFSTSRSHLVPPLAIGHARRDDRVPGGFFPEKVLNTNQRQRMLARGNFERRALIRTGHQQRQKQAGEQLFQ
jgi:hypothetical protein